MLICGCPLLINVLIYVLLLISLDQIICAYFCGVPSLIGVLISASVILISVAIERSILLYQFIGDLLFTMFISIMLIPAAMLVSR